MEETIKELLAVQKNILEELRGLRRDLAAKRDAEAPAAQAPRDAPEPAPRHSGLTLSELQDIGGSFMDAKKPGKKHKNESVDVGDLRESLLSEIKSRNKQKRDAFTEFEKINRR